ncbi:MAG: hypothetical protein ACD_12C00866G0001 [uncultured bacterium]|nr:MAG: hypothetical protein ACD_12C00866G0001 [uncultured bacterium]HBR79708.1 hypothetical protein [Candidatus Moranbacteria bacterium]
MKPNEAIKRLPKNVLLKYFGLLGKTIQTYIWIFDQSDGDPTHRDVARNLNIFISGTESLEKNVRAGYLKINTNGALVQDRASMDYPHAGATSEEFNQIAHGDIQIFEG